MAHGFRFAGIFCALAVVMTWPMLIEPAALYSTRQDYFLGLWDLWWVAQAATNSALSIFHTSLLYFPFGTGLEVQPLTLLQTLPATPITLWLGPLISQNFLIVFSFVLAGWGAAMLIYAVAGSEVAAVAGGIIFAFAPYHYVYLPELNLVSIGFIPLYFLATHSLARDPGLLRSLLAGIALAAVGLSSWYYGVAVGLVALVLSGHRLSASDPDMRIAQVKYEAAHWGLCGLVLAPVVLRMLGGFDLTEASPPSAIAGVSLWMEGFKGSKTEFALWSYVGILALAFAAFGIYPMRRSRSWIALVLVFLVLAWGERASIGNFEFSLPLAWLQRLPLMSAVRYPDRFFVLVQLGVAVLAGLGVARIHARVSSAGARARVWLAPLILILLLAEYWPGALTALSPPVGPAIPVAPSSSLAAGELAGGVFHIPTRFRNLDGELMYLQLTHRRPIAGGYLTRRKQGRALGYYRDPVLRWLLTKTAPGRPPDGVARVLAEKGFAYVVVHKRPLSAGAQPVPHRIAGPFSLGARTYLAQRLFPHYRNHGLTESTSRAWISALHGLLGTPVEDTEVAAIFRVPEVEEADD